MRLSMDGINGASVKYTADFGNHFSNFSLGKKYCPDFVINLTFTSFDRSFISLITHMNQLVVSEQSAT